MLVEITGKRYEEVLTVSTRQIAEDFEKTHREVIYAIEKDEHQIPKEQKAWRLKTKESYQC